MSTLSVHPALREEARSSKALVFTVVAMCLLFRPSMTWALAEPAFVVLIGIAAIYLLLGNKIYINTRKSVFVIFIFIYFGYIIAQGVAFGTVNLSIVLREIGFVVGPVIALLLMTPRMWPTAVKAVMTPVFLFLPSYLATAAFSLIPGMESLLIVGRFTLNMGDATYPVVWQFPYSLFIGGLVELGPFAFRRATGFVREPGIYQILIIFSYFGVDILRLKYRRLLKGLLAINLLLTFSTAGWGAFAASWLYYNVFAKQSDAGSVLSSFFRRIGAFLLFLPVGYWIFFGETKVSITEKLAGSSGQVRVLKALAALNAFLNNPAWGVGFQSPEVNTIHFIGILAQIGLVGVLLAFSFILFPNWTLVRQRHPVLVLLIPIVLTTVLAQPLWGKTLFLLLIVIVVGYPYAAYNASPDAPTLGPANAQPDS